MVTLDGTDGRPETIGWGILGTGKIAREFAEGLRSLPDARIVAIASRTEANALAFAREFAVPRWYPAAEALVNDPSVRVVYVATPSFKHKEHCLLSLEAGKAVICEKPFALNAAEAREVVEHARRKHLFCMEAMWMRFLPAMSKLRDLIASGTIGEVCMVRADLGVRVPVGHYSTALNLDMGGGAMLDLGVYPLSLACLLLGAPDQTVSRASIGPNGADEDSAALLSYRGGQLAVVTASLRAHLPGEGLVLGTRGQIRIHSPLYRPHRLSVQVFSETSPRSEAVSRGARWLARARRRPFVRAAYLRCEWLVRPFLESRSTGVVVPFEGNGYNYEAAEVMRCLSRGELESRIMPLDETLRIMDLLDAIRRQWKVDLPAPGHRRNRSSNFSG